MVLRALLIGLVLLGPQAAQAEDRVALGWGRMFDNDAIGDMQDRWQTGSYAVSQLRGPAWRGSLPSRPFDLLELKFATMLVSPAAIDAPMPTDRRFAGMFSLGVHTQFDWHGLETGLGADLYMTGPQTGISQFQEWIHNGLGLPEGKTYADQIGNGLHPTLTAEIGRTLDLGPALHVRPFAAAQVGIESWARVGADMTLGHFGTGSVMLRDVVTGQRHRAVQGDVVTGYSFTAGGDIARIFDSALLPEGGAAVLSDTRTRLRMGVQWQGKRNAVFYGLTWLGPEFDGQPEGQVVGSLNIQIFF